MTVPQETDVLILGGGCAGLSLGRHLALATRDPVTRPFRVDIVEARSTYTNDRTWCCWRVEPHSLDEIVAHRWSKMTVRSGSRTVPIDCPSTPYEMIESSAFYAHCQSVVAASPSVRLHLGEHISAAPQPHENGWQIQTAQGPITARTIVDTRPPTRPSAAYARLWQSFVGQTVTCDDRRFDPQTVLLMDFAPASTKLLAFTYVLPRSEHHALIETTVFATEQFTAADLAAQQAQAVDTLCGGMPVAISRTESGILPMGLTRAKPPPRPDGTSGYVQAGIMSGAARPSTGYAFQRIQHWAAACAASLQRGSGPIGPKLDTPLTAWMDGLFLEVLRANPAQGPDLFLSLFERAGAGSIIRFLSDRATLADRLAIIHALPLGLFLGQASRLAFDQMRRAA